MSLVFWYNVYVHFSLFTSSCHLGTMPALCTNSWQCLYFYKKEFTCTHENIYASQRVHKIVVNVHVECYQIKKHTIVCKTNTLWTELILRKNTLIYTCTNISHTSSYLLRWNKLESWKAKVLPSMIIIKKYTIVMRISEIGSKNKIRYVIDLLRFI